MTRVYGPTGSVEVPSGTSGGIDPHAYEAHTFHTGRYWQYHVPGVIQHDRGYRVLDAGRSLAGPSAHARGTPKCPAGMVSGTISS
jgi:hypothetical protein